MTFSVPVAAWGFLGQRGHQQKGWESLTMATKQERQKSRRKKRGQEHSRKQLPVQFVELLYARNQGHQRLLCRWATAYLKPSTSVCLWPAFTTCWKQYDYPFLTKDTYTGQWEVMGAHSGRPSQGGSCLLLVALTLIQAAGEEHRGQPGLFTWLTGVGEPLAWACLSFHGAFCLVSPDAGGLPLQWVF